MDSLLKVYVISREEEAQGTKISLSTLAVTPPTNIVKRATAKASHVTPGPVTPSSISAIVSVEGHTLSHC